jgi:hypothetical protein
MLLPILRHRSVPHYSPETAAPRSVPAARLEEHLTFLVAGDFGARATLYVPTAAVSAAKRCAPAPSTAVRAAGYSNACSIALRSACSKDDELNLPRLRVRAAGTGDKIGTLLGTGGAGFWHMARGRHRAARIRRA